MPNPKNKIIKILNPAKFGMVGVLDRRDLPPESAMLLENADFSKFEGKICKCPGFDLHPLSFPLPIYLDNVLDLGVLNFTSEGGSGIQRALLLVHIEDIDDVFKYYLREYDVLTKSFFPWQTGTGGLPLQGLAAGDTTTPDVIIWQQLSDGAVRGAVGNDLSHKPIWLGYIQRELNKNGFFALYNFTEKTDRDEFVDTHLSQSIPEVSLGFGGYNLLSAEASSPNWGVLGTGDYKLLAVPVFDGYQISDTRHLLDYSNVKPFLKNLTTAATEGYMLFTTTLELKWKTQGKHDSPRMTGINIYFSERLYYADQFTAWKHIKYLDIRDGNAITSFAPIYANGGWIEAEGCLRANNNYGFSSGTSQVFDDLMIEILVGNTLERYPITQITFSASAPFTKVYFTAHGETGLVNGNYYTFSINERWSGYASGGVPEITTATIPLLISGQEPPLEAAPPWLPDPNLWEYDDTYKIPSASVNYKHFIEFKDRLVCGNVYDYVNDRKYLLRVYWSAPKLDPDGGLDLPYDFVDLPRIENDEIMGFGDAYDYLIIFTRFKTYRAKFDPIFSLQQTVFDFGLVAPRSLIKHNGIWYFLGRESQNISCYAWDGINKPMDIGRNFYPHLTAALNADGCEIERSVGWIDGITKQYRISINTYD